MLSSAWARIVILAVALEAALMFGAFAYVGADLHLRFGLSFTLVGIVVGTFGVGGLIYAASVTQLVGRLGQTGLALYGSVLLGLAYLMLALAPTPWIAPIAVTAIGLGFYMLHNTLQTNATQIVRKPARPQSRCFPPPSISGRRSASRCLRRRSTISAGRPCSSSWRCSCRCSAGGSRRACAGGRSRSGGNGRASDPPAKADQRPRETRSISVA